MYIEQLKKYNPNLWLYLPLPILMLALMVINYIASDGIDTNKMMQETIQKIGKNGMFLITIVPLAAFLLVVLFYNRFFQNNSLRVLTTSRKSIDWKRFFTSFFIWGIFTVGSLILGYFIAPDDLIWNFNPQKFFVFLILAILLIPLQTSFEEYLFRGHLMQGLGLATNTRWVPLIITSVSFGLMHIANPEVEKLGLLVMIYYIGTGFLLGIMTLMDEGMELALGFHASNNLIGAIMVTSDWSAMQTHSLFIDRSNPLDSSIVSVVLPVFVFYPIVLLMLAKIYKWSNWKEKLLGNLKDV